jgi:hypothetical protein
MTTDKRGVVRDAWSIVRTYWASEEKWSVWGFLLAVVAFVCPAPIPGTVGRPPRHIVLGLLIVLWRFYASGTHHAIPTRSPWEEPTSYNVGVPRAPCQNRLI